MADDDKPGTNLASNGVAVAALAAMGESIIFIVKRRLWICGRSSEATLQERTAPQTVVARLWQIPFAAVRKSLDKRGKQDPEQQCGQDPKPRKSAKHHWRKKVIETRLWSASPCRAVPIRKMSNVDAAHAMPCWPASNRLASFPKMRSILIISFGRSVLSTLLQRQLRSTNQQFCRLRFRG